MKTIEKFYVIGIATKTINLPQRAEIEIPQLWEQFMTQNVMLDIPNKMNNDIYCIYTHYEGDYTMPYTTVIGCRVSSLDLVPENRIGITIETGNYQQFTAKGSLTDNIVYEQWLAIWKTELNRNYLADFEIYKENANPENTEVDIFVGIK